MLSDSTLEVALLVRLIDELNRVDEAHVQGASKHWYGLRSWCHSRWAVLVAIHYSILKI
jgi:hypothetical protein